MTPSRRRPIGSSLPHVSARDFLFSLERLGMKFGLENMRALCAALDHPEQRFRSIIVAGTNGKGSVTAMTSAALHAAGHRTARYTSPHLERLEERYVIGEREVTPEDLERSAARIQATVERLVQDGVLPTLPTFFECATALAFDLFRTANVEVAVVEVGLGGRLDATNVLTPMAAAITSIDFDHQDLLGGTLTSIAREKAGIIKPGIPVVVGRMPAEASHVIEETCRAQQASYISVPDMVEASFSLDDGRTLAAFRSRTTDRALADVSLALRGRHQIDNAAVAFQLLEEIDRRGIRVDLASTRAGLTHAAWPGRIEPIAWHGASVILDAAHNPAGARALRQYLDDAGWRDVTLVLGVMKDKDLTGMLSALLPIAATIICTTPPTPRALPADALAAHASAIAPPDLEVMVMAYPADAIAAAARPGARVVAAGSIFLIGPLRGILR
jgi:dihydrofolate synthase / folylpolyglutamate synthase